MARLKLIERYVLDRDEAAFEILVERHAPMVRRVCRRLLNDPNDVDDAVQATFLVLVRKARLVRRRELLANWLYGVACRVSARARENANRRGSRLARLANTSGNEEKSSIHADATSDPEIDKQWVVWLHEEVCRLPEKYQTPVILCYFEGLTHDAAAIRLKWPRSATPAQGRAWIAGLSAAISARQNNENGQEILSKLDEPVTVSFPDKTPLELQEAASEMDDQNFPRTGPIPGVIGGGGMGGMGGMM